MFSSGASVGFYQGDVMKLFDDIQNLRPTRFPSVPRLFNRLYEKVNATIEQAGGTSKTLYDWAYSAKKEKLDSGVNPEHGLWDTVVFSKLRAKLGGRVRFIVTGSAPISANVFQFLQMCAPLAPPSLVPLTHWHTHTRNTVACHDTLLIALTHLTFSSCFGCAVLQGYGLTETTAGMCLTLPGDWKGGHVGPPLPNFEIKLEDVSEMSYFANPDPKSGKPPQGEVCVRGSGLFKGYYKLPDKTCVSCISTVLYRDERSVCVCGSGASLTLRSVRRSWTMAAGSTLVVR